jgi:hypothetical protein
MKSTLQIPKHVSRCSKLETDATHTEQDRTVPTSGSLSSGVQAAFDVHSQPVGPIHDLPLDCNTEILLHLEGARHLVSLISCCFTK